MAGLQLSGLASGFDWKSIVDQLMAVEQAPITRLQVEQSKNEDRSSALERLTTKLGTLQSSADALSASGLYAKRTAALSTSGTSWSSTASDFTSTGNYSFNVTQLATSSKFGGSANIGKAIASDGNLTNITIGTLATSTAVTAGTFTVNGKQITIGTADKFEDVLALIKTETNDEVTAVYNPATDKIDLTAAPGKTIVLGSANDTSNFLSATRLRNADNATSLSSTYSLGSVSANSSLATAPLSSTLSGQATDGSGSFKINGISIDYNVNTDTLNTVLGKINASKAGVSATYDSTNDRINISNTSTGDVGFAFSDTTGNLLSALGVTSGTTTLTRGKNAEFTLNDGGTLVSMSNTLNVDSHGIAGLNVTATTTGAQTVTVSADTATPRSKIEDFIAKFNDVQDYINEQTKITTANGKVTTSTLTDNREIQLWSRKLRSLAFEAFGGGINRLQDIGIDFGSGTDKLEVKDGTKLNTALSTQSTDITSFFSDSTKGFSARFSSFFKGVLGDGTNKGIMAAQTDTLTNANKSIDLQIADIKRRLEQQRSVLESSFIAMEQAQSKSNNILAQLSKSFS